MHKTCSTGTIKAIVCDLDGTLLNSRKEISSANLAAIHAARERGIFVTICTGRIPEMMEAYIRVLGIQGPVITANGAVITDTSNNTIPYCEYADAQESAQAAQFCAARGFDHIAAGPEGVYYSRGSKRIERYVQYNNIAQKEHAMQMSLFPLEDYDIIKHIHVYKLLVAGLSNKQQQELEAYVKTMHSLSYTSSESGLLDVGAAAVSKGNGIRNLARIMGISTEEICVFGDYQNDISMFEAAGISVAMGNADETVKNCATFITKTNDEDGVASAINTYILGA
jgi:Cof subfamily protein (haloacid dehalogenase superfamily)